MLNVELRLYRRFDADLLSLYDMGVPLKEVAIQSVTAYAHGERLKYLIAKSEGYDFNDRRGLHLRLAIKDKKAEALLRQIKHGYRCQFVKTLIRQTLAELALSPFFSDPHYIQAENDRIQDAVRRKTDMESVLQEEIIILDGGRKKKRDYKKTVLREAGNKKQAEDGKGVAKQEPVREQKPSVPPEESQRIKIRTGRHKASESAGRKQGEPKEDGFVEFGGNLLRTDIFMQAEKDSKEAATDEADTKKTERNENFLQMFDSLS